MSGLVVVCGGREVDDHLRPVGERCRKTYRPPVAVLPPGHFVGHPLSMAWRPPTADEVVERARAADWALPGGQEPAGGELVGTCPTCRRPAPEVVALIRERKHANRRRST